MFSVKRSVKPLNPQEKAKVINNLIDTSPIYMTQFNNPIIASDLRIYSLAEYEELLMKGFKKSPFSKQNFIESPFPVLYPAFKKYVQSPKTLNLVKLATCPITHRIMSDPVIVCLAYTAPNKKILKLVVVCDKSSLDFLPESMKIKQRREWAELKDLISFFAGRLTPDMNRSSRTHAKSWYAALRQIKDDFPLLPPSSLRPPVPAPVTHNTSSSEHKEREHKQREFKQSDVRQTMFHSSFGTQSEERTVSEQMEYAQLSADRLELIDAAEQFSESTATPTGARSCFSLCYSSRR